MSTTDPAGDITPGGVAGDPNHVPREGTARVETRINTPGGYYTAGMGATGRGGENSAEHAADRAREMAGEARDKVSDMADDAREKVSDMADDARDKASGIASEASRRLESALSEAEDRIEEQTGLISMARQYPLAAAGVAFSVGFLLSGSSRGSSSGVIGKAMGQIRAALIGGVTAALTQELRSMVDDEGGFGNLVQTLTGNNPDR